VRREAGRLLLPVTSVLVSAGWQDCARTGFATETAGLVARWPRRLMKAQGSAEDYLGRQLTLS